MFALPVDNLASAGLQQLMSYVQSPFDESIHGLLQALPSMNRKGSFPTAGGGVSGDVSGLINWDLVRQAFTHPQATPATIKAGLDFLIRALSAYNTRQALLQKAREAQLEALLKQHQTYLNVLSQVGLPPDIRNLMLAKVRDIEDALKGFTGVPVMGMMNPQAQVGNMTMALPIPSQAQESGRVKRIPFLNLLDRGTSTTTP